MRFILAFIVWLFSASSFASNCGDVWGDGQNGPYDYTNFDAKGLKHIIGPDGVPQTHLHFAPSVEQLKHGVGNTGDVMSNLNYTLVQWPNHHRALWAVSRLSRQNGGRLPLKSKPGKERIYSFDRTVGCYFQRAMEFRPDDATVQYLYALHLQLTGNYEAAQVYYTKAYSLGLATPELEYNYGLLLFETGDLDGAREQAIKAQELGYTLPGLRRKLVSAGVEF